jgi:hypothetical protein
MNRYFRQLTRFGKSFSARRSQATMSPKFPAEPDPRAKSSGHGKHTADKWNQWRRERNQAGCALLCPHAHPGAKLRRI